MSEVFFKLQNLTQDMNRMRVNIFEISEVRWPGNVKYITDGGVLYYPGTVDQQKHSNGVGVLVDKETNKSVIGFVPLSKRVMMIQLQTSKIRVNIVQVYAPTTKKSRNSTQKLKSFGRGGTCT